MKIALADLAGELAPIREQVDAAIARVVDSARFIGGPEVTSLETELAAAAGCEHAIGVSSGTDALLVSLMALDIGPGDEVVTTPFSFFATAGAIVRLGAKPVFADIEEDSFNLDPALALAACSERTRAILPVHLYGRPAASIVGLPSGVALVEDGAQSLGAAPVVGIAHAVSFFPSKNLGAFGDAGAVLTHDGDIAERVRRLRNHGAKPKYIHGEVGGNFRLDALQAAVLRVKLPYLSGWNRARRANAEHYRSLFADARLPSELRLPSDTANHAYHQFVIRAPRRDALRGFLQSAGIATEVYYPRPFHLQDCFVELGYRRGTFPFAEAAADEVLALPIYPTLTAEQQGYVVDKIAAFYAL